MSTDDKTQILEPPGTDPVPAKVPVHLDPPARGPLSEAWHRLTRMPAAYVCLWIIVALVGISLISAFVPLTPYSFDQTSAEILQKPSATHLMGTDELGRDLLTRIIYGARVSISIGVFTALISFVIGTVYGSISGFCGGKVDVVLMRVVDILYSLPDLLVMILIGVIVGRDKGTVGVLMALGLVSWKSTARLVRAQLLQLKHEEFVDAARASGQGGVPIVLKHLLPNAMGPIIVTLTFIVPYAILSESTLSFIGLGLSPPAASWGTLASDGWRSLRSDPHLIFFPSMFIFITVLSFNLLGDGLRDALDPRTRFAKRSDS
jgi:oligopeptide transport system permease protein